MADIDTSNKFLVSARGQRIGVMRPTHDMSKEDALNLAAWLVAMVDVDPADFDKAVSDIESGL